MIRTILALLFAVCYLILGIPVLIVEWIIRKFNRHAADISSLRMVQWAFRVICFICGVKLTVKGEENVPKDKAVLYVCNHRSYFDIIITYARCPGLTGYISKDTLVMDCCGVKREVCRVGFALAEKHGFTFVGGHPMAGTQYSGFANSKADLFQGAPMVVIPRERDDILLLDRVKKLLTPAGFSHMTVTTAEHHDAMIAYTSQMCHVLSNAYVKSPRAQMHKGYSAGSYRDLTRVAWLNETMWTDLFLENRDYLLEELDRMIGYLGEYRDALEQGNGDRLCTLLAEGRICKEKVDAE